MRTLLNYREFIEATKEDIDQLQHREMDLTSTAQVGDLELSPS